jgi:transketolase
MTDMELQSVNALRMLAADAVQAADSGHSGMPLGAAPMAYELFARHLNFDPNEPDFFDRDRFVLSAGHGSALLYALLHLFGYGLSADELRAFRRPGSRTPGHPEYGRTPGVETSTGPLGQGIANAVGMAIAEAHLAARFNRPNAPLIDHFTYVLAGDGCMMEGIENEAASLAGALKLNKLIVLYDSNDITIEGGTAPVFCEDVCARHRALGWHAETVADGNDIDAIGAAIARAKKCGKPALIEVKTRIGYGSPLEGSAEAHGAPLGAENIGLTRKKLGWTAAPFTVPDGVRARTAELLNEKARFIAERRRTAAAYRAEYPALYREFESFLSGAGVRALTENPPSGLFDTPDKADATRNISGLILGRIADALPNLIGGSADLAPSNKSYLKGKGDFSAADRTGRNLHFGVREHAMAAVCNGISLHGGLLPYCATFFVFSDYMKGAMRLSALMNIPVLYILTHDSIGVGEDGPTHQPIEQLTALRAVPGFKVWRPCDGHETAAAYLSALSGTEPAALVLSRQTLPVAGGTVADAAKGGYILSEAGKAVPDALLLASGGEVGVALSAQALLRTAGVEARVVSMPCMEVFERQSPEYKEAVLPRGVRKRAAVEAGSPDGWYKYVGLDGAVVGMSTFGESAPSGFLFEKYGFTAKNIAETVIKL